MLRVYLSGPISGKNFDQATAWREVVATTLRKAGFSVLDPMRGKSFLSSQGHIEREVYEKLDDPRLSDKALVQRDKLDVLTADILLVNLLAADVASIGSIVEMAWAMDHNKLVVIAINDHNIHDHPFIREAGVFFPTLGAAVDYIIGCGVKEDSDAVHTTESA